MRSHLYHWLALSVWVVAARAAINPVLAINTYFGGTGQSQAQAIALDAAGNIYVAGDTDSTDFPASTSLRSGSAATPPPRNIFVTKWNPAGDRLLYATWIGGRGYDQASGIAVDSTGSVFVTGSTSSPDFPSTAAAQQKSFIGSRSPFVLKLSPDGTTLVYSTFLGGNDEIASAIAIDRAGNAYIAGNTAATAGGVCNPSSFQVNYPTSGDAFVRKLNPEGSALLFSTTLGGSCGETGASLAFDPSGKLWLSGTTWSKDFPISPDALQPSFGGGFGDGFLARLTSGGAVDYSTFIGGSGEDSVNAMAFDPAGNMWLTGSSAGFSQPASPDAFQPAYQNGGCFVLGFGPPLHYSNGNAYVMKLASDKTIAGLTYLGAYCYIQARAIAIDPQGYPWIAGSPGNNQTRGYSMPTVSPFRLDAGSGFISRFSPDLKQLVFSTWSDKINGLALDAGGDAWVAGTGFPGGSEKALAAKIESTVSAISLDSITTFYPYPSADITDLAPGKLVRIKGRGLGPAAKTPGVITSSGSVATSAGGVQVMFRDTAAPLLTVSSDEIQCAIPFGLAAGDVTVQVIYNGERSNAVNVRLKHTALEVLGVFNADFEINSGSNPAPAGSGVTMYLTGAGQTNPPSVDGQVNSTPLPQPVPLSVRAIVSSSMAVPVTFAAAAEGQIAGVIQVNFVPPGQPGQQMIGVSIAGNETYAVISVR